MPLPAWRIPTAASSRSTALTSPIASRASAASRWCSSLTRLYPTMSVRKNLSFGLRVSSVPRAEVARRVEWAARLLQIDELLDRKPSQLSGGQRQRVAIGRALVQHAKVFLFDEPLSNLDAKLRTEMRVELKRLHKELGATIVYVTHDQIEAMTLATRIAVMRAGRIEQYAAPDDLYEEPATLFVAGFVGSPAMNFLRGRLLAGKCACGCRSVCASLPLNGYRFRSSPAAGTGGGRWHSAGACRRLHATKPRDADHRCRDAVHGTDGRRYARLVPVRRAPVCPPGSCRRWRAESTAASGLSLLSRIMSRCSIRRARRGCSDRSCRRRPASTSFLSGGCSQPWPRTDASHPSPTCPDGSRGSVRQTGHCMAVGGLPPAMRFIARADSACGPTAGSSTYLPPRLLYSLANTPMASDSPLLV